MQYQVTRVWTHGADDVLAMFASYTHACEYAEQEAKHTAKLTTVKHYAIDTIVGDDPGLINAIPNGGK